ncbi:MULTISPECIES: type III pantothenate kinase [Terrabacteria group]|uniref:type III pantothenate kinase n=1 Tax=Bacillati TaxID=1783272 RepID=UPI001C6ECF98|nr:MULTISPECIES: type III pantothenate kinase [Terrabacteria group]MBW9212218.1 type III pantothenate kinase [Trueperella sp. zg.1013]
MLVCVDVGNTNIAIALMQGNTIVDRFRLMSKTPRTSDEYGFFLMNLMDKADVEVADLEGVILSSVVPKLNYSLISAFKKYLHCNTMMVNHKMKLNFQLVTPYAEQVGADRIVNCAYIHHFHSKGGIVVDFGTATTYDYVDEKGDFKYVIIQPGLGISAAALTSQTAQLPEVEIKKPNSILGTSTVTGMQAGMVYGYLGAVREIIQTAKKELNDEEAYVVATGGLGKVIAKELQEIDEYDGDLAYRGMRHLFDLNKEDYVKNSDD